MKVGDREIGRAHKPYLIAEISANHNGSVLEAYKLIQAAADCGADAVKIQCYTAESLTFKGESEEFIVRGGAWNGQTLHELYKSAETPPMMVRDLFKYAKRHKIEIFSSVFDFEGVDLVTELGAKCIKIASFELVDLPLIQYSAAKHLPMIISTGMGTRTEITDAVNIFHKFSDKPDQLALLHCISEYPTSPSEADLPALGPLSTLLGGSHVVGLSDHSLGVGVANAAVAFGASIIEKHVILDRSNGGPDASFSLEPSEFSLLVKACTEAWQAIQPAAPKKGSPNFLAYRKSLYAVRDVACGDNFSSENVRAIRPARGLPPRFYQSVLAGVATQNIQAGTALRREMVSTLN
jgi:pseudaminic acid synthase